MEEYGQQRIVLVYTKNLYIVSKSAKWKASINLNCIPDVFPETHKFSFATKSLIKVWSVRDIIYTLH